MSRLTLEFKGKVLKVYPVLKGTMVIGSDPKCTIYIDSLAVQAHHAEIHTENNQSILRDLGSLDGTYVNNHRLEFNHELKDGEMIRVGKHTLTYAFAEIFENEPAEPNFVPNGTPALSSTQERSITLSGWLQILNGKNLGKTLSLNKSMTNIGKQGVATAVITRRADGFFIQHLEGAQSPLVQNKPIGEKSLKLNDGDTIQIGNIRMQFFLA